MWTLHCSSLPSGSGRLGSKFHLPCKWLKKVGLDRSCIIALLLLSSGDPWWRHKNPGPHSYFKGGGPSVVSQIAALCKMLPAGIAMNYLSSERLIKEKN